MKILGDGWTAVTRDRSLSAQFEHTVGVTETGVEIFTLSPKGLHCPPYRALRPWQERSGSPEPPLPRTTPKVIVNDCGHASPLAALTQCGL